MDVTKRFVRPSSIGTSDHRGETSNCDRKLLNVKSRNQVTQASIFSSTISRRAERGA
jgi:hypothetical protein